MFWKSACGRFSLSLYSWLSNGWGHHRRQGKRRKKLMILFSSFHLPRDDSLAFPFPLKTFFAFSCGKWVSREGWDTNTSWAMGTDKDLEGGKEMRGRVCGYYTLADRRGKKVARSTIAILFSVAPKTGKLTSPFVCFLFSLYEEGKRNRNIANTRRRSELINQGQKVKEKRGDNKNYCTPEPKEKREKLWHSRPNFPLLLEKIIKVTKGKLLWTKPRIFTARRKEKSILFKAFFPHTGNPYQEESSYKPPFLPLLLFSAHINHCRHSLEREEEEEEGGAATKCFTNKSPYNPPSPSQTLGNKQKFHPLFLSLFFTTPCGRIDEAFSPPSTPHINAFFASPPPPSPDMRSRGWRKK